MNADDIEAKSEMSPLKDLDNLDDESSGSKLNISISGLVIVHCATHASLVKWRWLVLCQTAEMTPD